MYLIAVTTAVVWMLLPSSWHQRLQFKHWSLFGLRRLIEAPIEELRKLVSYRQTYRAYVNLRRQNRILRARLAGFDEVLRENARLQALLSLKRSLVYPSLAAQVVLRAPSQFHSNLIVNRGRRDGVEPGMPVIHTLGVVGKVTEVSQDWSRVVLLTDESFQAVALVKRSRETGLVGGFPPHKARMRYLEPDADVRVGDVIITSKISSQFPEGLLIGTVVDVRQDAQGLTKTAIIRPAAALNQLEEVLVILERRRPPR